VTDALLRFSIRSSAARALVCIASALLLHALLVIVLPRGARQAMLAIAHPVDLDLAEMKDEARPAPPPNVLPGPADTAEKPAPPHRAPRVLVKNETTARDSKDTVASGEDDANKGGLVSPTSTIDGPPPISSAPPSPPPRLAPPPVVVPPPAPAIDRSRAAALSGSNEWSCPWPDEAEADGIDIAVVVVTITVDASGHATRVDVVDPGHGFGRETRRCAMQRTYVPALDRDGRPTASTMKPIRVRFAR